MAATAPGSPHLALATHARGASGADDAGARASRDRVRRRATLAAVVLGGAAGFLVLARFVGGARVPRQATDLERDMVRALRFARGPKRDAVARTVTFFGSVPGGALVGLGATVLARHRPRAVLQIAVAAAGGLLSELAIKRFFRRKRPTLLPPLEVVGSTSFPSGHAMAAASIYLTLAFVAKRDVLVASGVAVSVAASRVYLGVHWPSDVLAGLALGTAWACATEAVLGQASSSNDISSSMTHVR